MTALASEDCLASLAAMRALGVRIDQQSPTHVLIHGGLARLAGCRPRALDMGNAGTAMRLFTGLLAAQPFDSQLIGDASLMKRPMERVAKPLREMGADVRTRQGTPPVDIVGGHRLHGIEYRMPVASAQVKSALLLAALYADGATTVIAPNITRDHSERMLASCGVRLDIAGLRVTVHPPQELTNQRIDVPGDFSSAAFFIVAGLLGAGTSGLLIENVGLNPTRTGLLDILRSMGGRIELRTRAPVRRNRWGSIGASPRPCAASRFPWSSCRLPSTNFRYCSVPPPVRRAETSRGARRTAREESDRIAAMSAGLTRLGVVHGVLPDGMRIEGRDSGAAFGAGEIDSFGDHRIAMSFAVASLRAAGAISIRDVANVATSFRGFVGLARSAGLGYPRIGPELGHG